MNTTTNKWFNTSLIGVVAPVDDEFLQLDIRIGGELGPEPGLLPEGDVSTEKQK